jgi:predicted naringenin-chalcone synthase
MRFINQLFTASLGEVWTNERTLKVYEQAFDRLPLDEKPREELREFVRYQLIGERKRRSVVPDPTKLSDFQSRASVFESGAEEALSQLAAQIAPAATAAEITFDAVLTTTSTGNLMPGLSYRLARHLGPLIQPNTLFLDLGNVGCTGSSKAINLARSLDPSFHNILVVAVELPTTLVDFKATEFDLWQGNCTFGDGAAAVWISDDMEQGPLALALEEIRYQQFAETGLHLIRWGYGDYYRFRLADHKTFEIDVKQLVAGALREAEAGWKEEPRWAIHPAGIALLMRLSRELKIPKEAITPSVAHYRENSNMSSTSVLYVLNELAATTPVGSAINVLTMGAGFNVVYGRVRRVR